MFKAIIVDDEPKVCQLINKLVNWDELGMEVCGIAHNGLDAFEFICKYKPEIVITDIRMPGLDGLEIIKKVKECGLDSKFIIISGYRHFEYAHNALKYNVEDYLLKPIKKSELNEVLKKICSNLTADYGRNTIENEIRTKLSSNRDSLRRHYISSLIFRQPDISKMKIDEANHEYQLKFQEGIFQTFSIKIDNLRDSVPNPGMNKIFEKICEITEKVLGDKCNEVITREFQTGVICIINYPKESIEGIKKCIKLLFDEIKNYLDFFGCFTITMGIGSYQTGISNIYDSFKSSCDAVKCRTALGVDRIIWASNLKFREISPTTVLNSEKERQLVNVFEALDTDSFKNLLSDLFSFFYSNSDINPCLAFEICDKIGDIFIDTMKALGFNQEQEKMLRSTISAGLERARSIREIHEFIYKTIVMCIENQLQEKRMQDYKPIRLAKQYISEHYMEQIRLDDIAELAHHNSAYFSTIFKKETGMNFSDYLINYRIDVAKEFLKSSNLSIGEIAEKIGYLETKYFSKLFNKVVGIKPSEYRKLYS